MTLNANWPGNLTFIGGGNMARSLIGGLISSGFDAGRIHVADPNPEARNALANDLGVHVYESSSDAAEHGDTWILAVKPQVVDAVCADLQDAAKAKPLVISILAGTPIQRIANALNVDTAIVRCMPNTPALVGKGATGLFANEESTDAQRAQAVALLSAVGIAEWVDRESLIDSVTAVSGSGPAYVFLLAEAMMDAGAKQGLPNEVARNLTIQTLVGASEMLAGSGVDAVTLRKNVTSPNGTTQAAIESFEANGFRDIVEKALEAARARGVELSK